MSAPRSPTKSRSTLAIPAEFEALAPPPSLLPGESIQQYRLIRRGIFAELAPQSTIQWLLAIDVVELSWEIQRYRSLRQTLLENFRCRAIEQSLRQIDLPGIPADFAENAAAHVRRNACLWRTDKDAAAEIDERLSGFGFDKHSINAEAYLQASDIYLVLETLLGSAQSRRSALLREFSDRRVVRHRL